MQSEAEQGQLVYRTLFDASIDAIVVVDQRGRIVMANAACEQLLGSTPEELVGAPVARLIPERFSHHRELAEAYRQEPRARPMGKGLDLFALHADGTEIPVDIALTPLFFDGQTWTACAIRDMRGKSRGAEALRVQATALQSAANGIVITDSAGFITWVNPAACEITGYAASELVGQHTRILKSGQHDGDFYRTLWDTVRRGDTWVGTITNRRRDGSFYHEEQTIAPVVDESEAVTHYIAIKQDVTDRLRAEESLAQAHAELGSQLLEIESLNRRLREESIRDPLTGLHNRRYFEETVEREVARAQRSKQPLAIAMLDIDHFKRINDSHGHATGDLVLQELARVLVDNLRGTDLVCRWGGEEFVAVLLDTELHHAAEKAEGLRRHVAERTVRGPAGVDVRCTVSIGLATLGVDEPSLHPALERADTALYLAKDRGRNRVEVSEVNATAI